MKREDNVVYVPLAEARNPNFALIARTSGSPGAAARMLQEALRAVDPELGTGMLGPAMWFVAAPRRGTDRAAVAGLLALTLILAMIGLYGVQVQAVAFRTRWCAMALGAASAQIQRMVVRQGMRPVMKDWSSDSSSARWREERSGRCWSRRFRLSIRLRSAPSRSH